MDNNREKLYEMFELLLKYCSNKLYFKNVDSETIIIRSDIKDASEAAAFVEAYEVVTHSRYTVWNSCKSAVRLVYSKVWVCRHRRACCKRRIQEDLGNCQARISIKIKIDTKDTRKRDIFMRMKPPFPAVIQIHYQHNHSTTDQQALKLSKIAREVKECFSEYFRRGMYGIRAKRIHENNLRKANFHSLDNASINPRLCSIYRLHIVWKESNKNAQLNKNEATVSKESKLKGGLKSNLEEDNSLDSEDSICFTKVKEIVSKFNKDSNTGDPVIDKNTGEILECEDESGEKSILDNSQIFKKPEVKEVNNSPEILIESYCSLAVQNNSMNNTAKQEQKVNFSHKTSIKLQPPTRIPVMSGHVTPDTQVIVYNASSNVSQTFTVRPVLSNSFNSSK